MNGSFTRGERHRGHDRIHHGYNNTVSNSSVNRTSRVAQVVSQFGVEATRGATLLALTSLTSAVSAFAVAAVSIGSAAKGTALTLALAEHAAGRSVGALLLDVGGGNNLGGEVKPFAQVVETLGRQGVVVVLPRELGLDVAAGGKGLASLNDE
jgi:hypothetical protein